MAVKGRLDSITKNIREVAVREGRQEAYNEILQLLQEKYLNVPEPDSSEARAILAVARELGEFLRTKVRA